MKSAAFTELVHACHSELGGRASADDVAKLVKERLDEDALQVIYDRGFVDHVRSALRTVNQTKRLPMAPCVDNEYVQLNLLSVAEYTTLIEQSMLASAVRARRAMAYAQECLRVHHVWIDPQNFAAEVAS